MKKTAVIFAFPWLLLLSCGQSGETATSSTSGVVVTHKAQAQSTMEGTLKTKFSSDFEYSEQVTLTDKAYYMTKHKEEILKTLEVVEKDSIPGKNI